MLKKPPQGHQTNPLKTLETKTGIPPQTTESLLAPWVTQAEPHEHEAGGHGSLGTGKMLPQLFTRSPGGGGCMPQQAQVGRDPSHRVPWRGRGGSCVPQQARSG